VVLVLTQQILGKKKELTVDITLRRSLRQYAGLRLQIDKNLLGEDGFRWEQELKRFLRKEPCWVSKPYELYFHPEQKKRGLIQGFDLKKHLEDEGLIARALSLESPLVKRWRERLETYPDELKDKSVFLWGSVRSAHSNRKLACLIWSSGRVLVYWNWLENKWDHRSPAVLDPEAELCSASGQVPSGTLDT
jgi:hypothetical protein